ncbi:metallophosphoesterase family protein [Nocardia terpenica]|uniref:Metallophosphoesterase n=1 Tax=Nocardia terpenica TaxID=455432 RepID=A0A6G9Z7E4_9NOCA|nr:metallophosphoesterase family protein [Nocardia terpenica]QIS20933.1 metallophosphoesterase [Nocardia terpenica]
MRCSRVAVVSDVHGVLPALEAVLAERDVLRAERIVVAGDIAAGPQPRETLDRLTALGERAILLRGNADRELVEYRRGTRSAIPDPIAPWAAEQLREDEVELLAGLPESVTLEIDGLGEVFFCHATPRDDEEVVLVDTRLERWAQVLAGLPDTIQTVVCGHTHMPFARLAHGLLVVNPGSVGTPYGRSGAHWALLGPGVELRRTPFDVAAACATVVAASSYPEVAQWCDYFLYARASDAEALTAFGPRDGREES